MNRIPGGSEVRSVTGIAGTWNSRIFPTSMAGLAIKRPMGAGQGKFGCGTVIEIRAGPGRR